MLVKMNMTGVLIDPESLPSSANAFAAILQASISYWRLKVCLCICFLLWSANYYFTDDNTKRCHKLSFACKIQGKKGIWLKILEGQADLVPIALKISR